MKRVLYFIGLKVLDVVGVVAGGYLLYWLGRLTNHIILKDGNTNIVVMVSAGVMTIVVVVIVIVLGYVVISVNWKKAGEMSEKS